MIGCQFFNLRAYARIRDECAENYENVYIYEFYGVGFFVRIADLEDLLSIPHFYNTRLVFLTSRQLYKFDYYKIRKSNTVNFLDFIAELA